MAFTEFGTGSNQAVKRWSNQLMRETFGKMDVTSLIGRGPGSVIQLRTELNKDPGDQIKFDLRVQDRGNGVNGDSRLKGYEDALTFYQDSLLINQKRKAHSFLGMSQQRTVHDLRAEGRDSLAEWYSWFIEAGLLAHAAGLCGDGNESVAGALGADTGAADFAGNTVTALDAGHLVDKTGSAFSIEMIDETLAKAKTQNPRVAPCRIGGREKYILYLHPYQTWSLRTETTGINWNQIHRDASARGPENPIYTGALGEYNNVIIRESEFVPINGSVVTAVLFGAGAMSIGFGNAWKTLSRGTGTGAFFSYEEEVDDYGNEMGVAAASVLGMKRNQFNSKAFGVMGIRTTESAPS